MTFDTGASHHVTNDPSSFTNFSDYGGPDKIVIRDSSGLKITHMGTSKIYSPIKSLMLDNVLCVFKPKACFTNKICINNKVSMKFFPTHFQVSDLRTGTIILKGKNQNDVYYTLSPTIPQIHLTTISGINPWHNWLGYPSTPVLESILVK